MPGRPTFIAPPVVILKFSLLFFIHFASEKKRNLLSLTASRMKVSVTLCDRSIAQFGQETISSIGNEKSCVLIQNG